MHYNSKYTATGDLRPGAICKSNPIFGIHLFQLCFMQIDEITSEAFERS